MKLKPIKENMVVHCKTEDEAKELIKWAYECGYSWVVGSDINTYYTFYTTDICYEMKGNSIRYDILNYFKERNYEVIEFSDLIISEEQEEKHMSAEEVLEWMKTNYTNMEVYREVFGCFYNYMDLFTNFTPQEIISKIESYEAQKKQEKEVEIEWVYRVFGAENYGEKFFDIEEDAIKWCEQLVKEQKHRQYARYEKVCRVKNEENN
jgi:hypothetical protein